MIQKEEDSYDHKDKIDKDIRTGYQAGRNNMLQDIKTI